MQEVAKQEQDNNNEDTLSVQSAEILNHLSGLHTCLKSAYQRYQNQFDTTHAGIMNGFTNRFTAWRQDNNHQVQGVGQLIAALKIEGVVPSHYILSVLRILNHPDLSNNKQQGGKSILRHLVDAVHAQGELLSAIDLCKEATDAARCDHDSVFNQYNYKIRYNEPINTLQNEHKDHCVYRCFFRDYLRATLVRWQQRPIDLKPVSELFDLFIYKDVVKLLLRYLGPQDLQSFGKATRVCYPRRQKVCDFWHASSKEAHFNATRGDRAAQLHDHIMYWRYDKIEALVGFDPKVLEVRVDYTMNRWQDQDQARSLSALEYAYLAGDENFIELFERLGKGHLREACYENKAELEAESLAMRSTLSDALNVFASNMSWGAVDRLWAAAPTWIYGLAYYFYNEKIYDGASVTGIEVGSDMFRGAAAAAACQRDDYPPPVGGWSRFGSRYPALSRAICQNHTPANSSRSSPM